MGLLCIFIQVKTTITRFNVWTSLCSGNDASIAIAEHVGGSVEGFLEMMNNKAKEIGANNTHFTSHMA